MTLIERMRVFFSRRPTEPWQAVRAWYDHPKGDIGFAWFADQCGVYEAEETLDPIALAKAEGMRTAFFLLWDLASADGDSVMQLQQRVTREGGET